MGQQVTHWAPFKANAAIAARRIVEVLTSDGNVSQAAANDDAIIGVSGSRAVAANETVEVAVAGIVEVEYGGTIARGALLTADSDGKAVSTTAAGKRIVGIAINSGVDNDIGLVLISPGSV